MELKFGMTWGSNSRVLSGKLKGFCGGLGWGQFQLKLKGMMVPCWSEIRDNANWGCRM